MVTYISYRGPVSLATYSTAARFLTAQSTYGYITPQTVTSTAGLLYSHFFQRPEYIERHKIIIEHECKLKKKKAGL